MVGAGAVLIQRQASLLALPDIGDPFDVAAMETEAVPAERDAFVIFRQAHSKFIPRPELPRTVLSAGPAVGWSNADPKLREWVEANREALALFTRAAGQADGQAHPLSKETSAIYEHVYLGDFVWLAVLEGSRLEEQGDITGAWAWYHAVLRMPPASRAGGPSSSDCLPPLTAGDCNPESHFGRPTRRPK